MLGNYNNEGDKMSCADAGYEQELTRLLIDYLYGFFPMYQEIKDKYWTRENELDEILPDTSNNHSLRTLLTDPGAVCDNQKSIIIFRGEKEGDGKKFYLNKLIETCYEAIPHFIWSDVKKIEEEGKLFRFPVLADKEAVKCWLDSSYDNEECDNDVINLTTQCFITKLDLKTDSQQAAARELAENLFQKGMLALFVAENLHDEPGKFIYRLLKIPSDMDAKPILIFLVDNSFSFESGEKEKAQFRYIDIKPLNERQILRYIALELPNHPELLNEVKSHKEILRLLSKQERLLKQIAIWKNSMSDNIDLELNILQIERDFIREIIGDDEEQHRQLCKAAKLELQNKEIPQEIIDTFSGTDFFYNGRFNYAESKYYLIAEEYILNKSKEISEAKYFPKTILEIIRQWSAEVQFYFAAFYCHNYRTKSQREKRLAKYYDWLISTLNNQDLRENYEFSPSEIIVGTLNFLGRTEDKLDDFINWAIGELESRDYDRKIFESLFSLRDVIDDNKIDDVLCRKYKELKNSGVKRRIIYFYSYNHYPLPDDIVKDLSDKNNSDVHLKYHIVSALIDTLDAPCDEERSWKSDSAYMGWIKMDNDPIMQSLLETFYYCKTKKFYKSDGYYLINCIDNLLSEFSNNDDYWKKAHAIGALYRMPWLDKENIQYIINKLSDIINGELENLHDSRNYNCLKPIRYIVEASAMLSVHESADDKASALVQTRFTELIRELGERYMSHDMPYGIHITVFSVFSMLICGLAYLKNNKLPIRKLIKKQLRTEIDLEILLQDCGIENVDGLWPEEYEYADELNEIVSYWECKSIPSLSSIVSISYDNSVGQIYANGERIGMGFMFREYHKSRHRVYCITCCHMFRKDDIGHIEFEPLISEENSKRYSMKLLYPAHDILDKGLTVKSPAKEDVSIWEINDIPYSIFIKIYNDDNWYDSVPGKDVVLKSYGFPLGKESVFGDAHGEPLEYIFKNPLRNGFYAFAPQNIKNDKIDKTFRGYSGAPIINDDDKICSMHKGYTDGLIIGIKAETIKELLTKKEWEENG